MRTFLLSFFLFAINFGFAQNCDCLTQFKFVKNYYEENHPGFQINIKPDSKKLDVYKKVCKKIEDKIRNSKLDDLCIFFLEDYIELLKDHHISIDPNLTKLSSINEASEKEVAELFASIAYQTHERFQYDSVQLINDLETRPVNSMEGIYKDASGNTVGVIANKTRGRDFVGIMIHSNSKLWKYGQKKMEFKHVRDNIYDITVYTRSFEKIGERTRVMNGAIPNFGIRKDAVERTQSGILPYEFTNLDQTTNYLRLHSFDARLFSELDSFYKVIDRQITSKPNLIIDIRGNGGGSEQCFFPLLSYAYTKPIEIEKLELWVTDNNIQLYQNRIDMMKKDSLNYGDDAIKGYERDIVRMKMAKRNSFISMSDKKPEPIVFDHVLSQPKKIILLQNRSTGSSAEGFIFMMAQSDKVITAGENSGGFVGFGNVLPLQTPGGCYIVNCTTMKYGDQYKYEFNGIPPQKYFPAKADWIKSAQQLCK